MEIIFFLPCVLTKQYLVHGIRLAYITSSVSLIHCNNKAVALHTAFSQKFLPATTYTCSTKVNKKVSYRKQIVR